MCNWDVFQIISEAPLRHSLSTMLTRPVPWVGLSPMAPAWAPWAVVC
jgi:hypothetical protein